MTKKSKKPKPELLVAYSTVWTCSSCGAWAGRFPKFLDDDGFWQCDKCGCTSVNIKEGRPYGPKSKDWDWIKKKFDECYGYMHPADFVTVRTSPSMKSMLRRSARRIFPLPQRQSDPVRWRRFPDYSGVDLIISMRLVTEHYQYA